MGMDMIKARCSCPGNVGLDDAGARAALHRFAEEADRDTLENFWAHFYPGGWESLDEGYADRGQLDLEDLAESQDSEPKVSWGRRHLAELLLEAYEEAITSRGVVVETSAGQEWWIAGGMTWGDDPEGCASLWLLDWAEVFDAKNICNMLDLSTAHIPLESMPAGSYDSEVSSAFPHRVQSHAYGWIVFLGDADLDGQAPDWAKPILKLARGTDCRFINFDAIGDVSPHLRDHTLGTDIERLADIHNNEEEENT